MSNITLFLLISAESISLNQLLEPEKRSNNVASTVTIIRLSCNIPLCIKIHKGILHESLIIVTVLATLFDHFFVRIQNDKKMYSTVETQRQPSDTKKSQFFGEIRK